MNAKFSQGSNGELIALSGGFLGKDEVVRPATDEDRVIYREEYAEFKKSLLPPSPPASDGASPSAAAAGGAVAGAGDTSPPSAS